MRKNAEKGRKRPGFSRLQVPLMVVSLLAITGFQVFWLRQSYREERKNLEFKSHVVFRETVLKLQGKSLELGRLLQDSTTGNVSIRVNSSGNTGESGSRELASYLNNVVISLVDSVRLPVEKAGQQRDITIVTTKDKKRSADSIKSRWRDKRNRSISFSQSDVMFRNDSVKHLEINSDGQPGEPIFRFLYRVDSLQDSLKLQDIDSACRASFREQGLSQDFEIIRQDTASVRPPRHFPDRPMDMDRVTIGFAKPVTYQVKLGSNFPYLLKKILNPLLFSLFLVGITALSFVLLYRNLLRQRRLTELKNDFISNVTHELKTPIATVGVAMEALRNFNALNDPQKTREYLDISQNELNRLSLLVDKVLRLSSFENHELQLSRESFDLQQLTQEVLNSFQLQMEKLGAVYQFETLGTDFNLFADKLHITSVLYNLVDNALKYSPERPEIHVLLSDKGAELELEISDKGMGIPAAYQAKVFDKFFRVPSGNTHNVKGYGLGLSYVAQVVNKHGGRIRVRSEEGSGSVFIVNLPKQEVSPF